MKKWYIVQTFSGFEQKVSEVLKDTIDKKQLKDSIEDVLVPMHEVTEVKRGKRVQRKKKYFPSYLLVKMEMKKELYHMIKNIQKVTGFLGPTGNPALVSDKEIGKLIGGIKMSIYYQNLEELLAAIEYAWMKCGETELTAEAALFQLIRKAESLVGPEAMEAAYDTAFEQFQKEMRKNE